MGVPPPPPPVRPCSIRAVGGLPARYASRADARDMETGDAVPCTADDYIAVLKERGLVGANKVEFSIAWPDPPTPSLGTNNDGPR